MDRCFYCGTIGELWQLLSGRLLVCACAECVKKAEEDREKRKNEQVEKIND
jgi:hypothetical protein